MKQAIGIHEVIKLRSALSAPVGLVPTMGYLHKGHISLVKAAQQICNSVVVSVFVNPTQFGPSEDLDKYPRDLKRDLALLAAEDVDLVWTPDANEMYPAGFQTWVTVDQIAQTLEGAQRPGHFRGVCTIVAKLLNVVRPDRAFFGQKDAQQALVIRRMAEDLNFSTNINICPTIREQDGLAMSSRNIFLNPDQRAAASCLYRALTAAKLAYLQGERNADLLKQIMADTLNDEPLAQVLYVSCSDFNALMEIPGEIDGRALLSLAVKIGEVRLIDNFILGGQ